MTMWRPPACYTTEALKQFIEAQANIEREVNHCLPWALLRWEHSYDSRWLPRLPRLRCWTA